MIKILLVIEVRLIANIFAEVLEEEADFMIVGRSENVEGALKIIQDRQVDVALVSVGLPGQSAVELTRSIVQSAPATKVLALGLADERMMC
jgi:DNA-binding NarL/FixJ family response regulator